MKTTAPPSQADLQTVRTIVARSGSSFLWAMRLMPKERREAMYALYALARELDDIADEPGEKEEKLKKLAAWREEIEALYSGTPSRPITRALLPATKTFQLEKTEFLELIAGMETDVNGPLVAPSAEELETYCRRVAGTIGLLSLAIFGRHDEASKRFSLALSEALQLTNILRDLAEDAKIGRLYLPNELLAKHGVDAATPEEALRHPALPEVCRSLAKQAEDKFCEAHSALEEATPAKLRPAIMMMAVYHETLKRLKNRDWKSLSPKVELSRTAKTWIAFRHLIVAQP